MEIRLQKVIADAGVASRRKAEELIRQGRVTVNGRVSTEMGLKVDPARDHVKVDGRHLKPAAPKAYVMLNKPGGVLTTLEGPGVEGRFTVQQFLRGVRQRVFRLAGWITMPRGSSCSPTMASWRNGCCIPAITSRRPIW